MDFLAIDVETANSDVSSICQIGIVGYDQGTIVEEWQSYVDPEDDFDPINVAIHGIDERCIDGAPTLEELSGTLHGFLDSRIAVCHTHFDRVAVNQGLQKYGQPRLSCVWLDSARVARRVWKEVAWKGYGLGNLCKILGYDFNHHDALEDAKAAGYVLLAAMRATNADVSEWLLRVEQPIEHPIDPTRPYREIKCDTNPDGPLFGEVVVFTGSLKTPRIDASRQAARIGCRVDSDVTKRTTLVVVGDQDTRKLAGKTKSRKHLKAEELILKGHTIRILREEDFQQLIQSY